MYSTAVVRPTRTTNDLENDSATITDITARTQTYIYLQPTLKQHWVNVSGISSKHATMTNAVLMLVHRP